MAGAALRASSVFSPPWRSLEGRHPYLYRVTLSFCLVLAGLHLGCIGVVNIEVVEDFPQSCKEADEPQHFVRFLPIKGRLEPVFAGCPRAHDAFDAPCDFALSDQVWLRPGGTDCTANDCLRARWSTVPLILAHCDPDENQGLLQQDDECDYCTTDCLGGPVSLGGTEVRVIELQGEMDQNPRLVQSLRPLSGCPIGSRPAPTAFPPTSDATFVLLSPGVSSSNLIEETMKRQVAALEVKLLPQPPFARALHALDTQRHCPTDESPCFMWQVGESDGRWEVNFNQDMRVTRIRVRKTDGTFIPPLHVVYAPGFDSDSHRLSDFDATRCGADLQAPPAGAPDDGNIDLTRCIPDINQPTETIDVRATPTYWETAPLLRLAWIVVFKRGDPRFGQVNENDQLTIEFTVE